MKKSDILRNLNATVEYDGHDYKLTAGIVRRKDNGEDCYSVELESLRARSVVICGIDKVNLKGGTSECTI